MYNLRTNQRSISLLDFPATVRPTSTTIVGDKLKISCTQTQGHDIKK